MYKNIKKHVFIFILKHFYYIRTYFNSDFLLHIACDTHIHTHTEYNACTYATCQVKYPKLWWLLLF